MPRKRNAIVFDLDDTLVDTSHVYWSARREFVHVMEAEGFSSAEVLDEFEKVDESHIETFGYIPDRYRRSMLATYMSLSKKHRVDRQESTKRKIRLCGGIILRQMPLLIEGAEELLGWAQKRFTIALLTRGISRLQLQKLRHAKIERFFSFIKVVPLKRAAEFRGMFAAMECNARDGWVVGDSIRSDINPGIEAGATCILFEYAHPHYVWQQEYGHLAIGSFFRVKRLLDAKDILKNPTSSQDKLVTSARPAQGRTSTTH